jgi:LacI family transcriptional regulator
MKGTLGVITNNRTPVFQSAVIAGVEDVAARQGYHVLVDSIAEDPEHPRPVSPGIEATAGVLVIANVLSDADLRAIHATGKPLSLVSHQVDGTAIPAIAPNNAQGIASLVRHVVEDCGRRQPVFIQGNMSQNDAQQRDYIFRQEAMRHLLPMPESVFLRGDFIPAVAAESLRQFIHTGTAFDSVIAADYLMGIAALDVLRESRLRVPEDISVVGFGDGAEAAAADLTTVAADVVDLGRRGARQLIGQIEGLQIRGLTLLSTTLIERRTSRTRA